MNMPADFAETMGEDASKMHKDMAALEHLLSLHMMFTLAEPESTEESMCADALEKVMNEMMKYPEKCLDAITVLLALIAHMRTGHSYLSFFQTAGINANFIVNDITGEKA